ncbi:MAG: TrkH family potassium uptake protein, partial [Duncaniella sp.]|nr:TrkH family potassium uptake protein [Duncaniella sp.]
MKRQIKHFHTHLPTVNFPVMLRLIGLLLLIESVFLLIPLGTSLWYGEREWRSFLFTFLLSAGCGASMAFLIHPHSLSMGKREGFLLTASVWVVFSLFGMLPFILLREGALSVSDAFFEAMSGFTTTGASPMLPIAHLPPGIIIWRSTMQ